MSAIIGSLRADLSMRSVAFNKGVDEAQRRLAGLQRTFRRVGRQLQGIGRGMLVGITAPLSAVAYKSVAAAKAQEQAVASVKAALDSMGDSAGYTLEQLGAMASKLQENSRYGDEDILGRVTANLLTFGNVQGEVFARAQQTALDLSARLGQDLQSSAIMLGKALNDPVKGLTALSRVGVSFTKVQEEQIKAMAKAGDVAGAQALMLAELERQYSGQAKALAELDSGRITQAWNAVGDALEDVGAIIQPIIADVADGIKRMAEAFQNLSPSAQRIIVIAGGLAAVLGPLVLAAGVMVTAFAAVAPALVGLAVPLGALATVAGVIVAAWDPLVAAVEFLRENVILLSPVIGALAVQLTAVLVPAIGSAVTGLVGLVSAIGVRLVSALGLARGALIVFRSALISTGIGALIVGAGMLVDWFIRLKQETGSWSGAFTAAGERIKHMWDAIRFTAQAFGISVKVMALEAVADLIESFQGMVAKVVGFFEDMGRRIIETITALPGKAREAMREFWQALTNPPEEKTPEDYAEHFGLDLYPQGFEAGVSFAEGYEAGSEETKALADETRAYLESVGDVDLSADGQWIVSGLIQGMRSKFAELKATAAELAASVRASIQSTLKIQSPSKETMKDGEDTAQGFIVGLRNKADALKKEAASLAASARTAFAAATAPIKLGTEAVEDTGEAAEEAKRQIEKLGQTGEVAGEVVTDAFEGAGQAGDRMGDKIAEGADRGLGALKKVRDEAKKTEGALSGLFDGFLDNLTSGNVKGAFQDLFKDLIKGGKSSFIDLIKAEFSSGGGGLVGVFTGLGESLRGGFKALGSISNGGGLLGGIGGAISKFLPVLGAVSTVFNLIKGFSSKKVIGAGLKLGIEDGEILGGTFERIRKTTFWGLFKKTYDRDKAFDDDTQKVFASQVLALQDAVKGAYASLGVTAADEVLRSVDLAVQRIETEGLSQDQIDAKVQGVFEQYGDALSQAIGAVDLQAAIDLANVNALLDPLGKAFAGSGTSWIAAASGATSALLEIAGGIENFGQKVAGFYDRFFTEAEKLDVAERQIARVFGDLGLAIPETDAAFKSLVLSQDLMTEAGQRTYNALLDLAPVFDDVTDAAERAAEIERLAREAAEAARTDLAFDLSSEAEQIDTLEARVSGVFASLGRAVPESLAGIRDMLGGFDLASAAGRDAFEAVREIVPDFRRIADYASQASQSLKEIRNGYTLDASRYATEWEAKLASELSRVQAYDQDLISGQNAELQRQSGLLTQILDYARRQADSSEAAFAFSQVT